MSQTVFVFEKEKGEEKMQRDKMVKIGLSGLLTVLLAISVFAFARPSVQYTEEWDFPRLDTVWMVRKYPSSVALEAAKAGDLDVLLGMIDPDDIREMMGDPYYWNTSMTTYGGFHMCYHGINCRDYAPDTAGVYANMFNRTEGFPLYPLNRSAFRLALQYIIGYETKEAWILDMYEFINRPQMFYIPFANEYWVNPYLDWYYENWDLAEQILINDGFTWDKGADGIEHTTDDIWYMPNGEKLIGGKDSADPGSGRYAGLDAGGNPIYGIFVACPGDGLAPPSHEISRRHVKKWNWFFMGENVTGVADSTNTALFIDLPDDTYEYIYFSPFYNRDHDIFMLCWGLGRNPDYLYDLFHPEVDFPGWGNSPGLVHDGLDRMLWALKYWKMNNWEILDFNIGDVPEKIIPACTYFDLSLFGITELDPGYVVQVERVDPMGHVYDEILTEGVDYEIITGPPLQVHILKDITLQPGEVLEIILANDPPHHRVITDIEETRYICWLAQWKLYYLNPYNPIYSRNYINMFNPGLTCWVDSEGYGSADSGSGSTGLWTLASIHWEGQPVGGEIKWHVAGKTESINPILASWVYENMIINRLFDSLYVVHPQYHSDIPWAAIDWEMIPWESEIPNVPNGMILRIYLRNDLYWHDGIHITAADVKWNFDFIKSIEAPELVGLWMDYVKSEVPDDYIVDIYINATGLWKAYDYLGSALVFPRQIWEPFWGDYEGAIAFEPQDYTYEEWTGNPPPEDKPDLTAYVGSGPFYMVFWDYGTGMGKLKKNTRYWHGIPPNPPNGPYATTTWQDKNPIMTAVKAPSRIWPGEDVEFSVLAQNIDPKVSRTTTIDIYVDDALLDSIGPITLGPCNHSWYGPFYTGTLDCGKHNITLVHTETSTGKTFKYQHLIYVTIDADLYRDFFIDGRDLGVAGRAYGSYPGHPKWNPFADIVVDQFIDGRDLGKIGRKYGKGCPFD